MLDAETRHFVENIRTSIEARIDRLTSEVAGIASNANLAALTRRDLREIRSSMATKDDVRKLRDTILACSRRVENLRKEFSEGRKRKT